MATALSEGQLPEDVELKRLLWYILGGARGGENRARILHELCARPSNPNQLAIKLELDYRTVMHHIDVLRQNSLVSGEVGKYGAVLFLSPRLERNIELFEEICSALRFEFR